MDAGIEQEVEVEVDVEADIEVETDVDVELEVYVKVEVEVWDVVMAVTMADGVCGQRGIALGSGGGSCVCGLGTRPLSCQHPVEWRPLLHYGGHWPLRSMERDRPNTRHF